jgi:murein L,D-transpeptidase YafK
MGLGLDLLQRLGLGLVVALVLGMADGCSSTSQKDVPQAQRNVRSASPYADKILVKKSERKLYLLKDGRPIRTYRVSLGVNPKGHKERQGDNRTPEGLYYLDGRNPGSRFYKALHISYPNDKDRMAAAMRGVPPGGQIMIHGQPASSRIQDLQDMLRGADWTAGCIAVTNAEMEEIWGYTTNGTPIEILP